MIKFDREAAIKGIAAYRREQDVLLRLLKKRGRFTSHEFDSWYELREYRRPSKVAAVTGDSLILGYCVNGGTMWAKMLHLLQIMVFIGLVDSIKEDGVIVYKLP